MSRRQFSCLDMSEDYSLSEDDISCNEEDDPYFFALAKQMFQENEQSKVIQCDACDKTAQYGRGELEDTSGDVMFVSNKQSGCLEIPDRKIQRITFEKGSQITELRAESCYSRNRLREIEIPASVEIISGSCFGCSLVRAVFEKGSHLKSIGDRAFSSCSIREIEIPSSVETIGNDCFGRSLACVVFEKGSHLKSIGEGAFRETSLTEIEIPASVESIGSKAFPERISYIKWAPDSVIKTFSEGMCAGILNLQDIVIPKGIEVLGTECFSGCMNLRTVTFENGTRLLRIESSVFAATSLLRFEVPASVEFIHPCAFARCNIDCFSIAADNAHYKVDGHLIMGFNDTVMVSLVPLPSSADNDSGDYRRDKYLYIDAFKMGNTRITEIRIPATVERIEHGCFQNCSSLRSVEFETGSHLKSIADHAFHCTAITEFNIPASVTHIGANAFHGCESLICAVFTPDSNLTSMGSGAFSSCSQLREIELPTGLNEIPDGCFKDCMSLTRVVVRHGSCMKKIGQNAFTRSKIREFTVPASVEEIGYCCFISLYRAPQRNRRSGRSELHRIQFEPNSVLRVIHRQAFCGAPIKQIVIPATLEEIGYECFMKCLELKSVVFEKNSRCKVIRDYAFAEVSLSNITIPASVEKLGEECLGHVECITFEEGSRLKEIEKKVFRGLRMESLELPSGVEKLNMVFCDCQIGTLSIANDLFIISQGFVMTRDHNLCYVTTNCKSVIIPANVTKIGSGCFYGSSVESVGFEEPWSIKRIEPEAFKKTKLRHIEVPVGVKICDSGLFNTDLTFTPGMWLYGVRNAAEILYNDLFKSENGTEKAKVVSVAFTTGIHDIESYLAKYPFGKGSVLHVQKKMSVKPKDEHISRIVSQDNTPISNILRSSNRPVTEIYTDSRVTDSGCVFSAFLSTQSGTVEVAFFHRSLKSMIPKQRRRMYV